MYFLSFVSVSKKKVRVFSVSCRKVVVLCFTKSPDNETLVRTKHRSRRERYVKKSVPVQKHCVREMRVPQNSNLKLLFIKFRFIVPHSQAFRSCENLGKGQSVHSNGQRYNCLDVFWARLRCPYTYIKLHSKFSKVSPGRTFYYTFTHISEVTIF